LNLFGISLEGLTLGVLLALEFDPFAPPIADAAGRFVHAITIAGLIDSGRATGAGVRLGWGNRSLIVLRSGGIGFGLLLGATDISSTTLSVTSGGGSSLRSGVGLESGRGSGRVSLAVVAEALNLLGVGFQCLTLGVLLAFELDPFATPIADAAGRFVQAVPVSGLIDAGGTTGAGVRFSRSHWSLIVLRSGGIGFRLFLGAADVATTTLTFSRGGGGSSIILESSGGSGRVSLAVIAEALNLLGVGLQGLAFGVFFALEFDPFASPVANAAGRLVQAVTIAGLIDSGRASGAGVGFGWSSLNRGLTGGVLGFIVTLAALSVSNGHQTGGVESRRRSGRVIDVIMDQALDLPVSDVLAFRVGLGTLVFEPFASSATNAAGGLVQAIPFAGLVRTVRSRADVRGDRFGGLDRSVLGRASHVGDQGQENEADELVHIGWNE
jgi:hypothetical protein